MVSQKSSSSVLAMISIKSASATVVALDELIAVNYDFRGYPYLMPSPHPAARNFVTAK